MVYVGATPAADAELTDGTGFSIDSTIDPDAADEAWLTAVMVTVLGLGTVAGGVYTPAVEMVPVELDPPATLLTSQVTAAFVLFVTVAVSCTVAPSLTWLVPLTETEMAGAGGLGLETGGVFGLPPTVPEHPTPARQSTERLRVQTPLPLQKLTSLQVCMTRTPLMNR
jgi:hypothetical protein